MAGGVLLWLLCFSTTLGAALGGKVLVVPVEGSHWLSMKLLVKELVVRGHEVVLLVSETSVSEQALADCRTEVYPTPYTNEHVEDALEQFKQRLFLQPLKITDIFVNVQRWLDYTAMHVKVCDDLLHNPDTMGRLRTEGFDLVLTDPFLPCGPLLAHNLSVPAVYFMRGLPCGLENLAAQCPSPVSYVPRTFSGLTDIMTFPQRVKNMVMYAFESLSCLYMYGHFDELVGRYLEEDVTYRELISRGAVWLLRYDFTLITPRPLMPNMVPIGGINCVKPSPLPADLQEFVEGAGDAGFIVFTLGSLVDHMPAGHTKAFLDAFRKIPQRVVWRYTGVLPDDMPDNVKIMKWIPQNVLLAHPMAKLFISHGGSHGIYEAICNGVPMVMLPLFGDQPDNVDSMTSRGVATVVDMFDVSTEKLLEAFNKVLNDGSYKQRMESLSAVHRDQAVKPLDLAVFWTEFVMRHKGADHLVAGAQHLSWYQYHSLDTFCLLAAVLVTAAVVALKCCCFCARKCGLRVEKRKTE